MSGDRVVAWWSAGATSAVACKLALDFYGSDNVDLVYFKIGTAHPDNARFMRDCEKWYGKEIKSVRGKYDDQFDVIENTRYINGPTGARCTRELKKELRLKVQRETAYRAQVFGFEYAKDEINRALRFSDQFPDTNPQFPLISARLTKADCLRRLSEQGIEIPTMYTLGYPNNNCIGCVKGGAGYWNKIRIDFPETFQRMAELEREIGNSCLREHVWGGAFDANGAKLMVSKSLWLDELDPDRGRNQTIVMPDCGSLCEIKYTEIDHPRLHELFKGDFAPYKLPGTGNREQRIGGLKVIY